MSSNFFLKATGKLGSRSDASTGLEHPGKTASGSSTSSAEVSAASTESAGPTTRESLTLYQRALLIMAARVWRSRPTSWERSAFNVRSRSRGPKLAAVLGHYAAHKGERIASITTFKIATRDLLEICGDITVSQFDVTMQVKFVDALRNRGNAGSTIHAVVL